MISSRWIAVAICAACGGNHDSSPDPATPDAAAPSAAPSATCPACTGSEAKQAAFFDQMFTTWDAHATRILGMSASWLSDAPDSSVAYWKGYYGVSDPTFLAYLASLGVRSQTGVAKPALTTITADAHARGL
ncbi:MAG TPA: hypothetical protein VH165_09920 [Kofleriaceae bacterium]|jgi:hypothetical protein|nr:hypothetical protein [Kofleriaceae bacterium]